MARFAVKSMINTLINDNNTGDITADDLRRVLLFIYENAIVDGVWGGTVGLPIDIGDVRDLPTKMDELEKLIHKADPILQGQDYDAKALLRVFYSAITLRERLEITGAEPSIHLKTTAQSQDSYIAFIDENDKISLGLGFDQQSGMKGLFSMDHLGAIESQLILGSGGVKLVMVAPVDDPDNVATQGWVKQYTELETADVLISDPTGQPNKAECIAAMNAINKDFSIDTRFDIIDHSTGRRAGVEYVANGDVDETGVNFKFYAQPRLEVK